MNKIYLSKEISKHIGRVYGDGNQLWLTQSGSGCEFAFSGTKLELLLSCDDDSIKEDHFRNKPRVAVKVNGKIRIKKVIGQKDESFTLIDSETPVTAKISIIKLSEAAFSLCGVAVTANGELSSVPEYAKRIEFIGDSITCGYGVDDSNTQSDFSAEAEMLLKAMPAYALICLKLNTAFSLTAAMVS